MPASASPLGQCDACVGSGVNLQPGSPAGQAPSLLGSSSLPQLVRSFFAGSASLGPMPPLTKCRHSVKGGLLLTENSASPPCHPLVLEERFHPHE